MYRVGSAYVTDCARLAKAFDALAEKAQNRVLRPILTAAAKVVAEAERAAAPKLSGLMQQAIGASVTRSYSGGKQLFIAAGVRWGFRRLITLTPRKKLRIDRASRPERGAENARDPARYIDVVTGGRKAVAARKGSILYDSFGQRAIGTHAKAVAPNPFIERAYAAVAPRVTAEINQQGTAALEQLAGSEIGS